MVSIHYCQRVLASYQKGKSQQLGNSGELSQVLMKEALISFPRVLSEYETQENITKVFNVLSIFFLGRQEITYKAGMNEICAMLLTVFSSESDTFVMFSHIIENVFPRVLEK
jgi:hypothetical protein